MFKDLAAIWTINGTCLGAITLGEVRDSIAIILGIVSIISTIIIIRNNLRKGRKPWKPDETI